MFICPTCRGRVYCEMDAREYTASCQQEEGPHDKRFYHVRRHAGYCHNGKCSNGDLLVFFTPIGQGDSE